METIKSTIRKKIEIVIVGNRKVKRNDSQKNIVRGNSTEGLLTMAKIIPCQNCSKLHRDFKKPSNLKSIHEVKTITVIEASDSRLTTNQVEFSDELNEATEGEGENEISKEPHDIVKRSFPTTVGMNQTYNYKVLAEPLLDRRDFIQAKYPIKREAEIHLRHKQTGESLLDFIQEDQPIKRGFPSNATNSRIRNRKDEDEVKTKEIKDLKENNVKHEADKRKASEILEKIYVLSGTGYNDNLEKAILSEKNNLLIKSADQNGTEAQTNLMTQAFIRKPNGKKVVLQEKAFSEPVLNNVKFNDNPDRVDRVFKTNINFYDDLPERKPNSYFDPVSQYDSDRHYYSRPKPNYYAPHDSYSYKNYDSFDSRPKYRPSYDSYDSYPKYKPSTYDKDLKGIMIDVMPDHDAQYEYVPMEKEEDETGKVGQHSSSKYHKSNRDENDFGYYDHHKKRPFKSQYESGEVTNDYLPKNAGGYGYSPLPQMSYKHGKSKSKYQGHSGRPYNQHDDYGESDITRDDEESYPKYEKVQREYDYDTKGEGSEENVEHSDWKSYTKPLTLRVNLDKDEDETETDDSDGRIVARVTKVPKTLEEYHKLHRTWEKRPAKSKKQNFQPKIKPDKARHPSSTRPRAKQSSRYFPSTRESIEKPHLSYEFEGPNSHVSMDFATRRTPAYREQSESFQGGSNENEESEELEYSKQKNPVKVAPDIDSIFDGLDGSDRGFRRKTTEKPYKITRLAGKPLYSGEESSGEFKRKIIKDITPKLSLRDKEDLYNRLKNEIESKKFNPGVTESKQNDDIFKDLGLDFNIESHKDRDTYRHKYVGDRSKILIPKSGRDDDDNDHTYEKSQRKSWSFQIP